MAELLILPIITIFQNGDSIIQLKPERMNQIIDKNYARQVSILDDSEVLDKQAFFGSEAVLSSQDAVDHSFIFVQKFHDGLSIVQRRCCEYVNMKMLTHPLQKTFDSWSEVETKDQ